MTTPRVSVGLIVFNGERYLAETLDSLLGQTYADFEVIICDNASNDRTEEICRSYLSRDARIRYIRHPVNIGPAGNFCRALELARGEYFRCAAADDLVAPELLARSVDILDRDPAIVLTYPRTILIDEHGQRIGPYEDGLHLFDTKPSMRLRGLIRNLGLCNAIFGLVRTEVLSRTGLQRPFIGSDIILLAELCLRGRFHEIAEPMFYRRLHSGAQSSLKSTDSLLQYWRPNQSPGLGLRRWRLLLEQAQAVGRAPIDSAEKLRSWLLIGRQAWWKKDDLNKEILTLLRDVRQRPPDRALGT